jgi:putative oxidoreductase
MTATLQHTAPATTEATTATPTPRPTITERLTGPTVAAVRVVVSFLFAVHGLVGLWGFFGGIDGQGGSVVFASWPNWWASVIHLVAGVLVGVGLFTRTAALLCSGSMAYAYFVVHQPVALMPIVNGGEAAALYSWVYLLIAVLGPGAFALDNLRRRRTTS